MADVTVTANLVRPMPGAVISRYAAASTNCIPGKAVYLGSSGVEVADADVAASAQAIGVVVSVPNGKITVAVGDMVDVCVFGPVTGFTSLTPGGLMYSSVTAGAIADASPAGSSGDFRWIIGYAKDATTIHINPFTDIFTAL